MESEVSQSHDALQIAFQTMKERCQQLQTRLTMVEKENISSPQQPEECNLMDMMKTTNEKEINKIIQKQQKEIEELKKQKSQLVHHIYMVSSENRQLWKRLSKLTHTNKSLGKRLIKISDALKQHPPNEIPNLTYNFKEISEFLRPNASDKGISQNVEEKEHSLEEVSLCLMNSIIAEKSELERQYAEIVKLQSDVEINPQHVGFTYPEDIGGDSLEHLKCHDAKLVRIKEALLSQQKKLSNSLQNLKLMKNRKICNNCKNSTEKLMRQIGTQFDLDNTLRTNEITQTDPAGASMISDKKIQISDNKDENICPLCGVSYKKSSFDLFHEHVVGHFIDEISDNFEMIT